MAGRGIDGPTRADATSSRVGLAGVCLVVATPRSTDAINGSAPVAGRLVERTCDTGMLRSSATGRGATLLNRHNDLIRQQLARYRGREVDTRVTGFSPSSMDQAAGFDVPDTRSRRSAALASRSAPGYTPARSNWTVNVRGIAVHIGPRGLAALAEAGEVLVSSTVRDLVAGSGIMARNRTGARTS